MEEIQTYDHVKNVNIENEMKNCYIDYAMSVIVGRALPDVRDGLKPVHRRILFAMRELGMTPDKPFRKSARIVGEVLGKYHPHGDSSVYDAMVRMAQDFSTRYMTIRGQGNFGSVDGDGAAAMRYTEAKLSKIALEMLRDINKDTVDFIPNFDESEEEPTVLPSKFPHLLVNGSSGIAVGMATNIPPHNLGEVIDGTIAYINNPEITIDELTQYIKGPDFPTGGIILGKQGIQSTYKTGRGRIKVRSKVTIKEPTKKQKRRQLVISEIPYMVNKARLIEKIADLVKNKRVIGISDIRDESDLKHGIHVVIDLKKDANATIILNQLYKHTQLQDNFGVIMLALVEGQPKVLNLKEVLYYYIEHQVKVIRRRTQFELKKAQARAHILEGLRIALDHIDAVIALIRGSKDAQIAKKGLIERFGLSEIQAQAILDMRLQRLTGLEREKIESEYAELLKQIKNYEAILADKQLVFKIIKEELAEIKEKYNDARRSQFEVDVEDFAVEDLIKEEDVVITMTHIGYIKRISTMTYRSQKRGGKGIAALSTRENDFVEHLFTTTTHRHLLFFTNKGKLFQLKGYEVPEAGRTAKGTAIVNILNLEPDEKITTMLPVEDFDNHTFLIMATRQGTIKRVAISEYKTARRNGLIALKLRDNDELINVRIAEGHEDIMIGTRKGYSIRFNTQALRPLKRVSMGVRGIDLRPEDEVVGMDLVLEDSRVLCVSEKGYGKLTPTDAYRSQSRAGKGMQTYKNNTKSGDLVGFCLINPESDAIMLINNEGIVIRLLGSDISTVGRSTTGVRLMKLKPDERIVTTCKVYEEDNTEDEDDIEETQEESTTTNTNQ